MIEVAMYVALGFCVAALLALATLSAVWRRAVRLTRQTMEATSPMRHADVRAEISGIRAQAALEHRRLESGLERLQNELVSNRVARDRAEAAAGDLRKEFVARDQELADAQTREDELRQELVEREEALAIARARQRELERSLKRATATALEEKPGPNIEANFTEQDDLRKDPGAASLERASDLARIASLESEVTSLRRQLDTARETAGSAQQVPEQASDRAESQRAQREQSDRLFETESKLVAAQAEITRLSVLLEEAKSGDGTPAETRSAESETRSERITAETDRLEAENARLRADLHSNDAFLSLRQELKDLAASVTSKLSEAVPGSDDGQEETPPTTGSDQTPAADTPKTGPARRSARAKDTTITESLSARIGAARKRLKGDSDAQDDAEPGQSADAKRQTKTKPKSKPASSRTKRATSA